MAVRLILLFILTAASALTGRMLAMGGIRRADELHMLSEDLRLLKENTLTRLMPMPEALLKLKTEGFLCMGKALKNDKTLSLTDAFQKAWTSRTEEADTRRSLSALFEAVGGLSKKEHEQRYTEAIEEIRSAEQNARLQGREQMKLYTSLGALFGLSAGIFLI